ncbi:MAG: hypothetical protein NWE88_10410 [Candidatus Bathyarchaeota archaeon]|nr:hypothetical protein [Candidatus Bathyarchaeota archaeon]
MGTDSRQLEDETMAFSVDASSEPAASPEEAVSSLRELQEALGRVSGLASEEDMTVESFLETLGRLSVTISQIPLEPSLLPKRLGSVEEARMNDGGALILTTPDGGIETIDLTSFDNRDLLVTVLGDLLEKLRGLADGTHDLPEIIVDEPDIERAVVEESIILEPPMIEEVAEPEAMEMFLSTPKEIDMPVEEPPASIEPEPVDPPVETISPAPHSPVEYEPSPVPQIVEEPIFTPTVLPNSVLRRFRDKALRQRNEASRRISEIRWLREAQVHRMRSGVQEPWIQEETGVFVSMKKLLSRRSGKR